MSVEGSSIGLPDSVVNNLVRPSIEELNSLHKLVSAPVEAARRAAALHNRVEYHGMTSIEEGAQYDFRVNEPLLAHYLRKEFGFSEEDLDKLKVYVIGEHPQGKPHKFSEDPKENKRLRAFFFDPDIYDPDKSWAAIKEGDDGTHHIIFYAFNFWRDLNMERDAILRFAGIKRRTEKSWNALDKKTELLEKNKKFPQLGKRFTQYLANVLPDDAYESHVANILKRGLKPDGRIPLSRAIAYIDRFVFNIRGKNAIKDHLVIHETSHSFDYRWTWEDLARKLTQALLDFVLEKNSERDEIRLSKKSEWIGIVGFRAADPQGKHTFITAPEAV